MGFDLPKGFFPGSNSRFVIERISRLSCHRKVIFKGLTAPIQTGDITEEGKMRIAAFQEVFNWAAYKMI